MCAIKDNSLLVYGGEDEDDELITGGIIFDLTEKNKEILIQKDDQLKIISFYHGVMTRSGVVLGIALNDYNFRYVVAFKPEDYHCEILSNLGNLE